MGGSEERREEWGVAEGGGKWRVVGGSDLCSIQLQKLLLPTITMMIQKFSSGSAACHCRGGGVPAKSGETRSIPQREADRLAIVVY